MAAISFCLLRARTLPERRVEKEGLLFIDVLLLFGVPSFVLFVICSCLCLI